MSTTETKEISCPYCAETINAAAKKCKHCGEIIDPQMREIENLKNQQKQNLIVNNNNNNNNNNPQNGQKKNFGHGIHIILTLLTGGFWAIIWFIAYANRDKNIYY
jgi:hypothetical protein